MLASLCVSFASCNQVSESAVEKKPAEILSDAISNTFSDFFEEDLGIAKVLEKAKDKSSVNIYFESEDLLGGDVTGIGATLYSDVKNSSYVLNANALYKGETLSASAYANKKGFTVAGKSIFGTDDAYTLNFDSFMTNFKGSELANQLSIDDEDIDSVIKYVEKLEEDISASVKKNEKKYKDMMDNICALLEQNSSTEEIEDLDGEKIKCIVASYNITNDTFKAAFAHALEVTYGDLETAEKMLEGSVDEIFDDLADEMELNLTAKLYINKKTNKIAKIAVDGKVVSFSTDYFTEEVTKTEASVNAELAISDTKMVLSASAGPEGDVYKVKVELNKEKEGKNVTYSLSVDVGQGSAMKTILSGSVAFTEDGKLTVKGAIRITEGIKYEVELNGTFKTTSNSVAFEFTSVKFDDMTVTFKLGIEISSKVSMPKVPSGAKDVLDLTEADWEKIGEDIENSDFAKIFNDDVDEDIYYDDDIYYYE